MTKIRTVSEAKRKFFTHYSRPISSIYRRFVEELLVEMHLLSVNIDFTYDPIFALGIVTSFDSFMQGYQPAAELPAIFSALCYGVDQNPDQVRQDAKNVAASAHHIGLDAWVTAASSDQTSGDNLLLNTLTGIHQRHKFKYSRLFSIGLYTLLADQDPEVKDNDEKRQDYLTKLSELLDLSLDKVVKDLDLYRSNLEKVDQLLKVLEDAAEAERKKKEKQAAATTPAIEDAPVTTAESPES
ncbi:MULTISPECIES: photosystem II biogenesis protein Psp29 [Synechocystis]|uniref:Protein Thf1 n=1 Tax=Synechocystis salina LEGE 00031 TaxID=1828736 RepID=A0ABR9VUD9_9SYNC|nr:photosystem II biogenesis protein Psp29 [Synechocystis sp. LEGE 06083]MBE9241585.1 photosystem II biogenesis protein Psp29 [Synechocystis salina LEGE 00041]MBE9254959.1 photosystem II biogenesis protein Psp29 [Synechocystis salina LEGE 00031]